KVREIETPHAGYAARVGIGGIGRAGASARRVLQAEVVPHLVRQDGRRGRAPVPADRGVRAAPDVPQPRHTAGVADLHQAIVVPAARVGAAQRIELAHDGAPRTV